ncbi:zinc-binding domain-containing protein [Colletotrichum phormii]|uniref:Zinc-binding domain-containing protein n=1 Tax=Colletotrichum phormii TaxID=359342 RepID=A0AAI9ZH94_9PEZI|nr:zinc-binding domain-containing protein [Colletotrichum phormii]KAK1624559.1 zinc-binding domain-containing protein [Colletotrichum phormii]
MAKQKSIKPKTATRTSFKYPFLHKAVSNAVSNDLPSTWFNKNGSKESPNNEYSTNVMGKFKCDNTSCPNITWTSKKVAIVIKGYHGNGYDAVVFNQRCMSCKELGSFTLDKQSYVERIAYRLKRWAGVEMEQPFYAGKEGPPHQIDLCEGCKRGYCQRRNDFGF